MNTVEHPFKIMLEQLRYCVERHGGKTTITPSDIAVMDNLYRERLMVLNDPAFRADWLARNHATIAR